MQGMMKTILTAVLVMAAGIAGVAPRSVAAQTTTLRVGIQPGHSQYESGASSCDGSVNEVQINEAVAGLAADVLRQQGIQVDVLAGNINAVHNYTADAFISLHTDYCSRDQDNNVVMNSGFKVARWKGAPGSGLDGSGDASDRLVTAVWDEYELATRLPRDRENGHYTPCFLEYYALNPEIEGPICQGQHRQIQGIADTTPGAIIEMGWLSGDFAYMTSLAGQAQMAQGIANGILRFLNQAPAPQPGVTPLPIGQGTTATALVVDVSGSMGSTWQGGIKIESARSAAHQILNMLSQESQVDGGGHRVGVAAFSSNASLLQPLTIDINQVRQVIDSLSPHGSTNLGAGMETGNAILGQADPGESKILILLSDGMSNTGMERGQILTGPVQSAVNAGTCIYTVGFGDPGNLDEDLLRQIAAVSQTALGCGQYYYATDVIDLEGTYIRIRHQSTGNLLAEFAGNVAQGQTVQAGSVNVPPGQAEMAISLHWPGSKMELVLHDPAGNIIQPGDPNLRLTSYANLVYALVLQPTPGAWLVDVVGAEIPGLTEPFEVLVSARAAPVTPTPVVTPTQPPVKLPEPQSSGFETALLMLLLGGGGVALYVYATVLRRKRGVTQAAAGSLRPASLLVVSGPLAGQEFPIRGDSASIGRGAANQVVLSDQAVSRLHATLRYGQGEWYVQDQNSRSGTYVNGQRVAATRLGNGARILVGGTEMVFKLKS